MLLSLLMLMLMLALVQLLVELWSGSLCDPMCAEQPAAAHLQVKDDIPAQNLALLSRSNPMLKPASEASF